MSTVRTVYTNLRAAHSAIKDLNRLRQISAVLIRHGLGHLLGSSSGADSEVAQVIAEAADEVESPRTGKTQLTELSLRINEILQDLGPTFVKFGQILSTRTDLLPEELCARLAQLQNQVKPITFQEVSEVIREDLDAELHEIFSDFSVEPLACASIAQVHTAKLNVNTSDDGEGEPELVDVVVKVQRPGIRAVIEADLSILHFLARQAVDAFPEVEAFRPDHILVEFERAIIKELSFHFEAQNIKRFQRNFADWETVHIPVVYDERSTERVLVMERLDGVKITEAAPYGHPMDLIASETVRMLFKQVFEDGFFHGDLHPGNLLILKDSRIGLIDFGLVGRLSPMQRDAMADLLLHVTTRNHEGVARSLFEISIHQEAINYSQWESDVCELMDRHFASSSLAEVDFGQIVRDLIEGAVKHRAQIPSDYTMFFKSIITVEGIGKQVSPDLDLIAEIRPYAQRLIAQRYQPEQLLRGGIDAIQALSRFSKRLPHTTQQLMQQIENQQLGFQLSDAQLEQRQVAQRKIVNLIVAAFMSVSLVALGLAFLTLGVNLSWGERTGALMCGLGMLMGVRVVWYVMWRGPW